MKKLIFLCFFVAPFTTPALAQDGKTKPNVIKLNITSLFVRNYNITYERGLSRKLSVSLGIRDMPKGDLPFKKQFKKSVKSDKLNLDQFQLGNFAITPECRLYMGKGYMQGFYISLYARYTNFDISAPLQFTNKDGTTSQATFIGNVHSYSGGLTFGVEYTLWKILVLDVMIFGGNYGGCSGTMNANNINPPLTPGEQQSLQNSINDIKAKPFKITGQVQSSTQAVINASGPWGGIRTGINLGIRF